jgi:prepilin-type N-terminal cleavage/methylation domain-containing protein
MFKKLNKKGFTLVELMVVIVIIGILAAVAVPKFTVASDKAKASEFPTVLTSIYSGEHTWQAEKGTFFGGDQAGLATIGVQVPTSRYFSYSTNAAGSTAFTARANVKANFGKVTTSEFATITTDGVKDAGTELKKLQPNWTN